MSILDQLESKYGHWAIPGLLRYVAALNALCFVLVQFNPGYIAFLVLDRDLVLQGEVWRLLSYIFVPRLGGLFPDWLTMGFYVLYMLWVGDGLEKAWGAFRLNAYYLLGMIGTTIAALLANGDPAGFMLNTSLLLAFARFYPDTTILFMFVLPVKVKWLAWITGAALIYGLFISGWTQRLATIAALLNFFVFFGRELYEQARTHREVSERRMRFENDQRDAQGDALHRCHVCGRTEDTTPELEFRVAGDGEEYCAEHLPPRAG
ncbi:MAG: hypothetical protein ABMA13_21770 [Chthoniobacteraceae bacterium]